MTAALLGALAAGCGGGGGGGGAAPTNFNTAEFQANFGLGSINVLSTYSGGFTGTGQTIAVIDTGIDVDHPDLDANIAAASTDIVTSNSAFLNDIDGHGTQVSGVAAAERNGVGTHGVAFNSQILAIRADSIGSCLTLCTFTNADVADAIDFAVANGAGVINLSLGGGASNADFLASVQAAVNAGVIFAIASGNTGGADPLNPANLATTASFNGQIIAVGAVDSSNAIASFSNRAGTVQNFYLVAPGVSIVTTNIGGGTTTVSGTSYSAPHVAGAVALTRQRFPALSATQIVDALLAAATDLGASGTDAIFGRGLLNVSAALAPLGATTLPAGASEAEDARAMVALDSSDMQLGAAFGDGIADALSRRPAIIVDAFGRAFVADVSGYVSPANDRPALDTLLDSGARTRTLTTEIGTRGSLALGFADAPVETSEFARRFADTPGAVEDLDSPSFTLASGFGGDTEVAFGFGTSLAPSLDAARRAGVNFVSADLLAAPGLGMAGTGETVEVLQRLDRRTSVRLAAALGSRVFDDPYGERSRTTVALDLERRLAGGAPLGAHAATMSEEGSFLETVSSGAFEAADGALTGFLGFSASLPLAGAWTLHGRSHLGLTEVDEAGPGVVADFSRISSSAISLGLLRQAWLEEGDTLGLMVFQPLRGRERLGKCVASRGLRLREWGGDVCGPAGAAFPNWSRAWHRARLRAETRSRRRVSGQSDAALPTRPRRGRRTRDHCAVAVQDRVLTA